MAPPLLTPTPTKTPCRVHPRPQLYSTQDPRRYVTARRHPGKRLCPFGNRPSPSTPRHNLTSAGKVTCRTTQTYQDLPRLLTNWSTRTVRVGGVITVRLWGNGVTRTPSVGSFHPVRGGVPRPESRSWRAVAHLSRPFSLLESSTGSGEDTPVFSTGPDPHTSDPTDSRCGQSV